MTFGIALVGVALLSTACYYDPKVEVINGCGETIVFAHFDESHWAPEYQDQMFAEVEWKKIKAGESTKFDFTGWTEEPATITVVAEDAPQLWDPIEVEIELKDPADRDSGVIELAGNRCGL